MVMPVQLSTKTQQNNCAIIYDASNHHWWKFHRLAYVYETHNHKDVRDILKRVETQVKQRNLWAVGFVSYEAAPAFDDALDVNDPDFLPLIWIGLYHDPEKVNVNESVSIFPAPPNWQPSITTAEYQSSIRKIKEHIQRGNTYQVNYSYRLYAPFEQPAWTYFINMIHAQSYGYAAYIDTADWTICSASPELFFSFRDKELISRPMKGTASRGLWLLQDQKREAWLRQSEKNRAENTMIVDMVRNDMGKIAQRGTVRVARLYDVEKYPTVWQMTSTVQCTTSASFVEIFQALFPAASITGAPKAKTMSIIKELEPLPRNIYTGTIGFLSPHSIAQFNVAIRTLLVEKSNKTAEYGVGGGIVWDSVGSKELQETRIKAKILHQKSPEFIIESILWTPEEGFFLLDKHLNRLKESAAYFSRFVDIDDINNTLLKRVKTFQHPKKIRLLVPAHGKPVIDIRSISPLPQPYNIRLASSLSHSNNPFLYHKTSYRAIYKDALKRAPGYDDILFWNERGEITESSIANVALEIKGTLFTPPITAGLLPGVYRQFMLEQKKLKVARLTCEQARTCSRILLLNSVRGMWEAVLQ